MTQRSGAGPATGTALPREFKPKGGTANIYAGTRHSGGATFVTANGMALRPRLASRRVSTSTFDWGYEGRGAPAELSLAILAHHLGDEQRARRYHEHFLHSVIRHLPSEYWTLTSDEIDAALPAPGC